MTGNHKSKLLPGKPTQSPSRRGGSSVVRSKLSRYLWFWGKPKDPGKWSELEKNLVGIHVKASTPHRRLG